MRQYAYKVVACNAGDPAALRQELNALGAEGWRVLFFVKEGYLLWTLERASDERGRL